MSGYSSDRLLNSILSTENGIKKFTRFVEDALSCDVIFDEESGKYFLIESCKTSDEYWDCEICDDYHQPKEFLVCPHCGSWQDECPDSRLKELVAHGILKVSDIEESVFLDI